MMECGELEIKNAGQVMCDLLKELYPVCRSITGNGARETLRIIQGQVPLEIKEVASGTPVFDWQIPKEWNIKDAWVKNSQGEKVIDFQKSNLHILNYSVPFSGTVSLEELKKHLFTLPAQPSVIPYLTSYYKENWGFCLPHRQFLVLPEDNYQVYIDASLQDGVLNYGELYLKGKTQEEFLISTYICHPSMANDNLSGVVLTTFLAKMLQATDLKYSYRFLFIPETIGAITWLSKNESNVHNIKFGLVATCVGDAGKSTYKKSRQGDAMIDKVVQKVLEDSGQLFEISDFFPTGSDERQFCSPWFNLPVGSLMRTPYGRFKEYHNSGDNLDFVKPEFLADSLQKYLDVIYIVEHNATYVNQNPKGEPQLGKRGLYRTIGAQKSTQNETAMFWVLNLSDGAHSLLDIAVRSKINFKDIKQYADILVTAGLLREK